MMEARMIDNVYIECITKDAIENRKIWLNESVNEESMTKVIYFLEKLKRRDIVRGVKEPITIVVNSPGGLCYQGFMLISHIENMVKEGWEIITLTGGMSASMSFLIGLVGSKRKAYKYSSFLCHQPSCGVWGEAIKIKRQSKELDRLWDLSKKVIKKHSKMSTNLLNKIYNQSEDYIISSDKALELGIIDEII